MTIKGIYGSSVRPDIHSPNSGEALEKAIQVPQETFEAMRSTGKTKAAQKELNKIKELCRRRLLTELKELREELDKQGRDTICIKYPTWSEIIARQDEIEKEVSEWMNKS